VSELNLQNVLKEMIEIHQKYLWYHGSSIFIL